MADGIPERCPNPEFQFCPPASPQLVGFTFPDVPGVPRYRDHSGRRFRYGEQPDGDARQMPVAEWESNRAAIASELDRSVYHYDRYVSSLAALKSRRAVAGGPVFGDPSVAKSVYCEAAGYLSAIRTAVDIIVYVAARRAGATVQEAEHKNWSAYRQITGAPSSNDDVRALQSHKDWFLELNLYRNAMAHRGWHNQVAGYFSKGDTAPEAQDPFHDIMLLPDMTALQAGARPHSWTYNEARWLNDFIDRIVAGAERVVSDVCAAWQLPELQQGTIPIEKQPTVFLRVPLLRVLEGSSGSILHVFLSKKAGRDFVAYLERKGVQLHAGTYFRAVRRMTLDGFGAGFLLAYDSIFLTKSAELHLMDGVSGSPKIVDKVVFDPTATNGPVSQSLFVTTPVLDTEVLYVLDVGSEK